MSLGKLQLDGANFYHSHQKESGAHVVPHVRSFVKICEENSTFPKT
jgi:hypothetical protein